MQDEIQHARACFELARRYSPDDEGPGPLALDGALEQTEPATVVLDTLREGCVGQTLAALVSECSLGVVAPCAKALLAGAGWKRPDAGFGTIDAAHPA